MIDTRNISYTQGSPLNPVLDGVLLKTAPTIDIPKGETVSRVDPQPTIQEKSPVGNIFQDAPVIGGLTLEQTLDIWKIAFGSAETRQDIALGYTGGAVGITDTLGLTEPLFGVGDKQDILDIPIVDFPGSDSPLATTISTFSPQLGDTVAQFNFPEFKDIGKWLLIGAVAIGGLFLAGKYIGRKK